MALDKNLRSGYEALLNKYRAGIRDSSVMKNLALSAEAIGDNMFAHQVANEYISQIQDVFTKENIDYITRFTKYTTDRRI